MVGGIGRMVFGFGGRGDGGDLEAGMYCWEGKDWGWAGYNGLIR